MFNRLFLSLIGMALTIGIPALVTRILYHFHRLSKTSAIVIVAIAILLSFGWLQPKASFQNISDVVSLALMEVPCIVVLGALLASVIKATSEGRQKSGSQLWRDSQRHRMTKYEPKSSNNESESAEGCLDAILFFYLPWGWAIRKIDSPNAAVATKVVAWIILALHALALILFFRMF